MIPIKVKLSDVIDIYALSDAQAIELANFVTMHLANTYANNMIALAKTKLNSTRKMFVNGIRVIEISKTQAAVEIIGVMPNALTMGMPPFDMKVGFSKSPNRKSKAGGGWYMTIPMRYANPNAVASSTVFSGVMPDAVYQLARKLQSGKSLGKGDLPSGFDQAKFRPAIETAAGVIPAYEHDSPKFAGLTKTGSKGNSQYSTFRTVSDKSDPNSWIHKGLPATNIHKDALTMLDMAKESKMVIDAYLNSI